MPNDGAKNCPSIRFDVTKGTLEAMPGNYGGMPAGLRKVVAKWAPRIAGAQS